MYKRQGYSSAYALFGTEYGSVESSFIDKDGALIQIPAGTAHFLEHKMFESEEGDAFALYLSLIHISTPREWPGWLFSFLGNCAATPWASRNCGI